MDVSLKFTIDIFGAKWRTDVLDALAEHHLVEDFSTSHADKRVVHCGRTVLLQWLDILVILAIEGGRRSRPRRCLCGSSRLGALRSLRIFLGDFGRDSLCRPAEGRDGESLCCGGKVAVALESIYSSCA